MKKMTRQQLFVLIGASLFQCALLGTLVNCTGVLLAQIRIEYGFSMTRISAFTSLKGVAGAVCGAFCAAIFFKNKKALFMTVITIANVLSFMMLVFGADTWIWYAAAILQGITFSTSAIMVPFILNQWFPTGAGTAIGIAMAFSGLGGVVFNPLTSSLIGYFGWKWAVVVMGIITLLLGIPGVILMFTNPTPEQAKRAEDKRSGVVVSDDGFPIANFLLCTVVFLGGTMAMQFVQYVPMFIDNIGYSLAVGASVTSVLMIGNVAGKFLFGAFCDWLGIWKTIILALAMIAVSVALFMVLPNCLPMLYIAALLFGIVYALTMISVSQVSLAAYGSIGSKKYMGIHTSINSAVMAVFAFSIGLMFDASGSFNPLLLLIMSTCICSIIATNILRTKKVKE